ncbi:DUF4259 domain-containing protein [Halovulum sp. GXIMD14793]
MGAWGTGAFENDTALDWLSSFEKKGVVEVVRALEVIEENEDLDGPDVDIFLVAAEALAASYTGAPEQLEKLKPGLIEKHAKSLTAVAGLPARFRALRDKICDPEVSEAAELWEDEFQEWTADVDATLGRLP